MSADDLRAVARFAVSVAGLALPIFERHAPDDPRPREAIEAARTFANGAPRSNLQRRTATAAHHAARDAADPAAGKAATAAGHAAAAAYLHPIARPSQVKHILGAAASAIRALELDGEDADELLDQADRWSTLRLVQILRRYPPAPPGRSRVAELMRTLDVRLRAEPKHLLHGTRADLRPGELIEPGFRSNFGSGRTANHVYLTATLDAATWGAELAAGDGPGRIYIVEPTGPIEDDPNLTDAKFPGNITKSYRSRHPLRVLGEITDWEGHPADVLQTMRDNVERIRQAGIEADD